MSVLGGLSAWLGGMARLPYAVGLDRFLPPAMARLHPKHGTPAFAIVFQSALTSAFILASQAGATVREAYLVSLIQSGRAGKAVELYETWASDGFVPPPVTGSLAPRPSRL